MLQDKGYLSQIVVIIIIVIIILVNGYDVFGCICCVYDIRCTNLYINQFILDTQTNFYQPANTKLVFQNSVEWIVEMLKN